MSNEIETDRGVGDNTEIYHYFARLARRSCCFSRSVQALHRAIKLFIFACNRRQLSDSC